VFDLPLRKKELGANTRRLSALKAIWPAAKRPSRMPTAGGTAERREASLTAARAEGTIHLAEGSSAEPHSLRGVGLKLKTQQIAQ
jgi:hypothetical protein